jgi:hypothetical protein
MNSVWSPGVGPVGWPHGHTHTHRLLWHAHSAILKLIFNFGVFFCLCWCFIYQYPTLQWVDVFRKFDFPDFHVPDTFAFLLMVDVWRLACVGVPFPMECLFTEYRNKRGHLSLLAAALGAPVELINFAALPRIQRPLDGVPPSSIQVRLY